jgi:GNAT superfamily N-acetyltransferase
MAFRQVARQPAVFRIDWEDRFEVLAWAEDKTDDIAAFLLGTGTKSFADLRECADGSPASARRYVTRAREYMTNKPDADVGYAASSLVYDRTTRELVAVCLCCGCSVYAIEVHPAFQRQGLATNMLKRALSIHARHGTPEFHLWRDDDSPGVRAYERLGFTPTGEVEDPPDSWKKAEIADGTDAAR